MKFQKLKSFITIDFPNISDIFNIFIYLLYFYGNLSDFFKEDIKNFKEKNLLLYGFFKFSKLFYFNIKIKITIINWAFDKYPIFEFDFKKLKLKI